MRSTAALVIRSRARWFGLGSTLSIAEPTITPAIASMAAAPSKSAREGIRVHRSRGSQTVSVAAPNTSNAFLAGAVATPAAGMSRVPTTCASPHIFSSTQRCGDLHRFQLREGTLNGVFEIGCGVLILVDGLLTRLAAVPMIIDMLGALLITSYPFFGARSAVSRRTRLVGLHPRSPCRPGPAVRQAVSASGRAGAYSLDAYLTRRTPVPATSSGPPRR